MTKTCILLGSRSDIGRALVPHMVADGWTVHQWARGQVLPPASWDLVVIPIGRVAPVRHWADCTSHEWAMAIDSNVIDPVHLLRAIWLQQKPNSAVCFFAGANPNAPRENYSAYSVGKMALLKAVEHLDLESPDCKMFALAPGVVLTKIHQATKDAGVANDVLDRAVRDGGTPIPKIWEAIKWCLAAPKSVVGGRNICVSDPLGPELAARLATHPSLFKLRRME